MLQSQIIEMSEIKNHGVQKTIHMRSGPLQLEQTKIVYVVRANLPNMYMIAEQIRSLPEDKQHEIHLCQVPRRSAFCERVLEEEGACDDLSFCDLDLGFIPVDKDVLSMESPEAFRMTKLIGDKTHLFDVAKTLMHLQVVTGIIGQVKGKGSDAKIVAEMMIKLRAELGMQDEQRNCPDAVSTLVLVDRESDMVTPMLTQLTYSGRIDDTFGIKDGIAMVPGAIVPGKHQHTEESHAPIRVPLKPTDEYYCRMRDRPLKKCEEVLREAERSMIHMSQWNASGFADDSFAAKADFSMLSAPSSWAHAPGQEESGAGNARDKDKELWSLHRALSSHLLAASAYSTFRRQVEVEHALLQGTISYEAAMDFIEELMYRRGPFGRVVRLLSLLSTLCGGIRKFAHYKHELLQVCVCVCVCVRAHVCVPFAHTLTRTSCCRRTGTSTCSRYRTSREVG